MLKRHPNRLIHSRCNRNALKPSGNLRSTNSMVSVAAVIVAAGRGSRAGGDMPKQFRPIGGDSMLRRALSIFVEHGEVSAVQPVVHSDDLDLYRKEALGLDLLPPVFGGATRQCSVRAGLEALAARQPA